jgi:hypothetical protein
MAAAAILAAGPAFSQSSTSRPSTSYPDTTKSLSQLEKDCQGGNQQACQDASRMRAATMGTHDNRSTGSTSTIPPTTSGGQTMAPNAPHGSPSR